VEKATVDKILRDAGFKKDKTSLDLGLGTSFRGKRTRNWIVCAFARAASDGYGRIDLGLRLYLDAGGKSYGTVHRFFAIGALESKLADALTQLKELAANEEFLKCEKCKIRLVSLKEPPLGKSWRPFLSCAGMVVGRRREAGITFKFNPCDGTSRRIPPLLEYR
jgi:hypothetical protein